jgi:hypothetical protein
MYVFKVLTILSTSVLIHYYNEYIGPNQGDRKAVGKPPERG